MTTNSHSLYRAGSSVPGGNWPVKSLSNVAFNLALTRTGKVSITMVYALIGVFRISARGANPPFSPSLPFHGCVETGYKWSPRRLSFSGLQPARRLHQLPQLPLRVCSDQIMPSPVVWDLGKSECTLPVTSRWDLTSSCHAVYPSVSVRICPPVIGVVSRPLTAGLW